MNEQQYKWKIKYTLKNGDELWGLYIGPENDSTSVIKKLLDGQPDNAWISTFGSNEKHNLLVRIGEVAAIDISIYV